MLCSSVTLLILAGSSALASTDTPDHDGKTLFDGLFLARGPVAKAHPDLPLEQSGRPWTDAEAERLITGMQRLDPGFFTTFQAAVTSGDRVRIDRAIESAYELAGRAAPPPGQVVGPDATFIYHNRSIFKATHMVVNKNKYWTGEPTEKTALSHERWVDDVAETFAR
ncbi:hypothetical protein HII36_07345 [Nonomuraea sp. NN258]|uniref:hypothetical protein n=1 Tax=Nonomuraea antri TaxID=2730852 RepID=UPI001568A8EC|nr:hypothetical protein [Nonomuraea antri]NRQ31656.1 hypothetical protein [Nonomuraea antri]